MKIKVAAIQMNSLINDIDANHREAEKYINEASKAGANLILLPELLPTGYGWTHAIGTQLNPVEERQ